MFSPRSSRMKNGPNSSVLHCSMRLAKKKDPNSPREIAKAAEEKSFVAVTKGARDYYGNEGGKLSHDLTATEDVVRCTQQRMQLDRHIQQIIEGRTLKAKIRFKIDDREFVKVLLKLIEIRDNLVQLQPQFTADIDSMIRHLTNYNFNKIEYTPISELLERHVDAELRGDQPPPSREAPLNLPPMPNETQLKKLEEKVHRKNGQSTVHPRRIKLSARAELSAKKLKDALEAKKKAAEERRRITKKKLLQVQTHRKQTELLLEKENGLPAIMRDRPSIKNMNQDKSITKLLRILFDYVDDQVNFWEKYRLHFALRLIKKESQKRLERRVLHLLKTNIVKLGMNPSMNSAEENKDDQHVSSICTLYYKMLVMFKDIFVKRDSTLDIMWNFYVSGKDLKESSKMTDKNKNTQTKKPYSPFATHVESQTLSKHNAEMIATVPFFIQRWRAIGAVRDLKTDENVKMNPLEKAPVNIGALHVCEISEFAWPPRKEQSIGTILSHMRLPNEMNILRFAYENFYSFNRRKQQLKFCLDMGNVVLIRKWPKGKVAVQCTTAQAALLLQFNKRGKFTLKELAYVLRLNTEMTAHILLSLIATKDELAVIQDNQIVQNSLHRNPEKQSPRAQRRKHALEWFSKPQIDQTKPANWKPSKYEYQTWTMSKPPSREEDDRIERNRQRRRKARIKSQIGNETFHIEKKNISGDGDDVNPFLNQYNSDLMTTNTESTSRDSTKLLPTISFESNNRCTYVENQDIYQKKTRSKFSSDGKKKRSANNINNIVSSDLNKSSKSLKSLICPKGNRGIIVKVSKGEIIENSSVFAINNAYYDQQEMHGKIIELSRPLVDTYDDGNSSSAMNSSKLHNDSCTPKSYSPVNSSRLYTQRNQEHQIISASKGVRLGTAIIGSSTTGPRNTETFLKC